MDSLSPKAEASSASMSTTTASCASYSVGETYSDVAKKRPRVRPILAAKMRFDR